MDTLPYTTCFDCGTEFDQYADEDVCPDCLMAEMTCDGCGRPGDGMHQVYVSGWRLVLCALCDGGDAT